jgi:hypothetical protein
MDEQQKIMKQFIPTECPECSKHFFIGVQTALPVISVTTQLNVDNAKTAIKARLEEITFSSKEEKKEILNWLNNPETILDFSDVESLVRQISTEQCEKNK